MALCKCQRDTFWWTWKAELALIFLRLRTRERMRVASPEVVLVAYLARTLPQGLIVSHWQPSVFIICPRNNLPSSQAISLTAHTKYLLSNTEAKISCWKGHPGPKWPGKTRVFQCVCMCVHRTHRASSPNKLVPSTESTQGCHQQEGKTGTEQKQSLQLSPGTWELKEDQIQVTGPKIVSVFSHLFAELLQSFPYTLMQNTNNFLLELGGRAEQHPSH